MHVYTIYLWNYYTWLYIMLRIGMQEWETDKIEMIFYKYYVHIKQICGTNLNGVRAYMTDSIRLN